MFIFNMLRSLRNAFITGIVVILPLGVTIIVIRFLLDKIGTPASKYFFWFLDPELKSMPIVQLGLEFISVLVVLLLVTLLGYGSRIFIGRILLNSMELLLDRLPFVSTVYRSVQQIVQTFSQQKKAVFQEVVLIEYPRKRCYGDPDGVMSLCLQSMSGHRGCLSASVQLVELGFHSGGREA